MGQLIPMLMKEMSGVRIKQLSSETLYEGPVSEMVLFKLPKGVNLPMHDHPGMAIILLVIKGSLLFKNYNYIKDRGHGIIECAEDTPVRMAKGS
mmetsp:Transcript_53527/g.116826  ORF Transcript_53527/g.116826 Transcript_53527/m.116826 type:complete len:94 (-) Transcript_53527:366-647(-)